MKSLYEMECLNDLNSDSKKDDSDEDTDKVIVKEDDSLDVFNWLYWFVFKIIISMYQTLVFKINILFHFNQ